MEYVTYDDFFANNAQYDVEITCIPMLVNLAKPLFLLPPL